MIQFKDMRRRILYALLAILIIGILGFIVFRLRERQATPESTLASTQEEVKAPDSDQDSLADWEEELWHTNPHKGDTDGDGVSDGEEVQTNHDPLKRGPGDVLPPRATSTTATYAEGSGYQYEFDEKLGSSLTDKLALNLTSNYLLARDQGPLDADTKNQIVSELTTDASKLIAEQKVYTKDDIRITVDTAGKKEAYKDSLIAAVTATSQAIGSKEAAAMEKAISSQKLSDFAPLVTVAPAYEALTTKLLALPVPTSLAVDHLLLVNEVASAAHGLRIMGSKTNDPAGLLVGFGAYRQAYLAITNTIIPSIALKLSTAQ